MNYKFIILIAACIFLCSCSGQSSNTGNLTARANGRIKQSETEVYKNPGEYFHENLTDDPEEFDQASERTEEKAERIADKVTEFDNVEKASVIIIGNRAVIGIETPDYLDDDGLMKLKEEITKKIRGEEDSIDHVAVTAGPELKRRIDNVADFASDGKHAQINDKTQELIDELTPAF